MTAATLNSNLCTRLASEARQDHDRMSPAPWTVRDDVLYSDSELDGKIQLAEFCGEAMEEDDAAVARQRNNLVEVAEQLEVAAKIGEVVRRLHETSERAPDVRAIPMRLVRQDVFEELMALVGGKK